MHSTFCTQFKGRINEKYRQKMSVVSISRCRCTHRRRDQCKNLILFFFCCHAITHNSSAHKRLRKELYIRIETSHTLRSHITVIITHCKRQIIWKQKQQTHAYIYIYHSLKNLFLFSYGTFGYFDFQIDTWFYRILFYSGLTWV